MQNETVGLGVESTEHLITAYLQSHPLCEDCLKNGKYSHATVVGFRRPPRGSAKIYCLYNINNLKAYCNTCYDMKRSITKGNCMEIKIKYFTDIDQINFIDDNKSDWVDLRAAKDVELKAGEFKLIPLGVGMILPDGYEAHIVPRSSTYKKFKVLQVNGVGIIDNSYSGNEDQWMFPALAMEDTVIRKNDRICQFRIFEKMPRVEFMRVNKLNDKSRGGFGSTGVK